MNAMFNGNSDNVVVEGDAAIVMRVLRNHSILTTKRLKSLVRQSLENEDGFEPVFSHWGQSDLILSPKGSASNWFQAKRFASASGPAARQRPGFKIRFTTRGLYIPFTKQHL